MSSIRRIIAILFVLACVLPVGARAQAGLELSAVEVDLWPEFDRPTMLVIYHITLPPETTLPAEMSVRIPAAAGTPNAVAARHPDGSLFNLTYTQEDGGEWSRLVFQATTPEVQIEYYDPSLAKEGAARHFEYRWPGDYAVGNFVIRVQQPVGAREMRISPSLGSGQPASGGLVYYNSEVGPLAKGQSFTIIVDYQKDTDELSAPSVPVDASGPLDNTALGRKTMSEALPYLLGGIGVLLIGGGAYWYWLSGREKAQPKKQRRGARRKPGAPEASGAAAAEGGHVYCHQCGKRAASGDRFCRACGTQLRV